MRGSNKDEWQNMRVCFGELAEVQVQLTGCDEVELGDSIPVVQHVVEEEYVLWIGRGL